MFADIQKEAITNEPLFLFLFSIFASMSSNTTKNTMLEKPPLFYENYGQRERIYVNQGGTSSGKTYTLIDMFFVVAMQEKGVIITVVGQDVPNLKAGAFRDAKKIRSESNIYRKWFYKPNETNRELRCINGSIIEFKSYEDSQDAKSGKRDYLFINEANGIDYMIYFELEQRTYKKVYIDYNPNSRFWVHEKVIGQPDVKLIISDHRHNPFLDEATHLRIESIADPELYKVYARGKTGKITGLIYNNWVECSEMPEIYKRRWLGMDFGFTNDPTALIDVRLSEGELWIDEITYDYNLTNPEIYKIIEDNGLLRVPIIADSAEPKSIKEIENLGADIEGAEKGADSIKNGIDILKRYKINVTRRSKNVIRELLGYKWSVKKDAETATNKPIDEFNHALDAIRYVALNRLSERDEITGITIKNN